MSKVIIARPRALTADALVESPAARRRWLIAPLLVAAPVVAILVGRNGGFGITPATACTGMPHTTLVPADATLVPVNAHMLAIGGTHALDGVPYPKDMKLLQAGSELAVQGRFIGLAAAEIKPTAPLTAGLTYEVYGYTDKTTFKVSALTDTLRPHFSVQGGVVILPPPQPRGSCSPGELLSLAVTVTDDSPTLLFVWVGDERHPPDLGQAPDWAVLPVQGKIIFRRSFRCDACTGRPAVALIAMDVAGNVSEQALVLPNKKVPAVDTFLVRSMEAFADPASIGPDAARKAAGVVPAQQPSPPLASPAPSLASPAPSAPQPANANQPLASANPASPPPGCGGCAASRHGTATGLFTLLALGFAARWSVRRRRAPSY